MHGKEWIIPELAPFALFFSLAEIFIDGFKLGFEGTTQFFLGRFPSSSKARDDTDKSRDDDYSKAYHSSCEGPLFHPPEFRAGGRALGIVSHGLFLLSLQKNGLIAQLCHGQLACPWGSSNTAGPASSGTRRNTAGPASSGTRRG
jgi:hypothetical protein